MIKIIIMPSGTRVPVCEIKAYWPEGPDKTMYVRGVETYTVPIDVSLFDRAMVILGTNENLVIVELDDLKAVDAKKLMLMPPPPLI